MNDCSLTQREHFSLCLTVWEMTPICLKQREELLGHDSHRENDLFQLDNGTDWNMYKNISVEENSYLKPFLNDCKWNDILMVWICHHWTKFTNENRQKIVSGLLMVMKESILSNRSLFSFSLFIYSFSPLTYLGLFNENLFLKWEWKKSLVREITRKMD